MKKILLLGCGHSREKRMWIGDQTSWDGELVTLDHNPDCKPEVIHDLKMLPYPFPDNEFDEIHIYGVLEHLSDQGDHVGFFAQFEEFYRILKPSGHFLAVVPSEKSVQQWGDPSHCRVINMITLGFLSQENYKQCGKTMMTDFRNIYKADFVVSWHHDDGELLNFVLSPIKEVPGWTSENTSTK
jgi:predicted SAM-dependent methyltransferase